jgi:hypothetical protein
MKTLKLIPMIVIGAILLFAGMFFMGSLQRAFGDVTSEMRTVTPDTYRYYTFFATSTAQTNFATTTTATSTNINQWTNSSGVIDKGYFVIAGAKKVTMYFSRDAGTGGNAGSTNFKVQSSPDGTTWYDFTRLVQATSTSVSNAVEQSTATISAATTTLQYGLDLDYDSTFAVRCIVVETTDGSHSCAASATY